MNITKKQIFKRRRRCFCRHHLYILLKYLTNITYFQSCYLSNTHEILSLCRVPFNERWIIPSHCWKWICMRKALACDNEQNADKCYTECGTTRSDCCGGRWRLTGPRGGASAHAPSTRENLVTNFSCEDLTSASLGCEALWKHTISNTQTHYLEWTEHTSIFLWDIFPL
jgi:hypothetical protein